MAARDRAILELRARASAALQGIEDATAAAVADVVDQVANALTAYIEAFPDADVEELVDIMAALIEDGAMKAADFMLDMGSQVVDIAAGVQARALTAMGITTANEIAAAVTVWSDQYKVDLLTEGHQLWYGRIKAEALHPGGVLRSTLEAANVWGESMTDAADRLVAADPGFSNFPPLDMDPVARARMIVRTESTRFDNAVSVSLSEAVGITQFVNVGVGDNRQSDICQEATEQDPMTLDEWKGSKWGPAPRHPNCRCALVGVGQEFSATDDDKELAGVMA